jgi:uncharacterized protein (DUF885 family)
MRRNARILIITVTLTTFVGGAACSRRNATDDGLSNSSSAAWTTLTTRFIEEYLRAQPAFAVAAGRHEYDGKLPDWSADGLRTEAARLESIRRDAEGFSPGSLNRAQQLEREHILALVDSDLFWLRKAEAPFRNPTWYLGNLDPDVYLSREYAPLDQRMRAYVAYARAVPVAVAQIRANVRTPLATTFVERAISGFGGYAEFYRNDVPRIFADVKDAALQHEFATANAAAAQSMADITRYFESLRQGATNEFATGPELFSTMLRDTERVTVSLDALEAAGRADLERNTAALTEACAQFLPGGTIRACIDKMEAHKPTRSAVEQARSELDELRGFVQQQGLMTIPSQEQARVAESPPYNRANFAYINVPGPFDARMPSTYFVAPPDAKWSAAERAAYVPGLARLRFTTIHEVWPGHYAQFLVTNRSRTIGSIFIGYAFVEGWAHYAEEMMWEAGFGSGDPEQHIGQLSMALLRNVRFLSAIGLHARGMTVAESEQLFRERAFTDPATARQQAARGTYDPAYLNYTLGKLMLRKLRADWMTKRGKPDPPTSASDWREFHDSFLSHGGPPVPLIRKVMLGNDSPAL